MDNLLADPQDKKWDMLWFTAMADDELSKHQFFRDLPHERKEITLEMLREAEEYLDYTTSVD